MRTQNRTLMGSPIARTLAIIGWLLAGAILVPAIYGVITAMPDVARYMRMRSM